MKKLVLLALVIVSLKSYSQVKITQILGYEYNNQKNVFSQNVVGKEASSIDGGGNHSMVVIKLNRIPGQEYKYISRKLKITAQYEEDGKVIEVYEQREVTVSYVDDTFYVPVIIERGAVEVTIKAELYEGGKLVSSKKQFLLSTSGD